MKKENMNEEQHVLDKVIKEISAMLNEELDGYDDLQFKFRRDPDRYGIAYRTTTENIRKYKSSVEKPYFARIDFNEDNHTNIDTYYIGKYGITDEKSNTLVLDWRAPISSLYYDSEVGKTSFDCPDGKINGDLKLKRQFEIEEGVLLDYYDVDIVSNDDLLQKYLHENNDMRLKNIVSTIQSEQNVAIRKSAYLNTIIQGVAGSGKTTIALHRIAYLVYNYRNNIKNNQYMVIGPNDVFLKYIESVLPDLDVSGIEQLTFEKLALEMIEEDIKIKPVSKQLTQHLSKKTTSNVEKIKASEQYINLLNNFIVKYFESLADNDILIEGFIVIPKDVVRNLLEISFKDSTSYQQVADRFVMLASNYVINNSEQIKNNFGKYISLYNQGQSNKQKNEFGYYSDEFNKKMSDLKEFRNFMNATREEIEKGAKPTIRKFINKLKKSPLKFYELFINDLYNKVDKSSDLYELCKETKENIKKSEYDFEDLAPLMYIRSRFGLSNYYKNFKHVVIDEAQDLGVANYIALKTCLPNAYFSIYGDIAQSIYDYRSIDSWDELQSVFPGIEVTKFRKSYRTTDQIMSVANAVSQSIGLDASELSVRQGKQVTFNQVESDNNAKYISEKIKEFKDRGYKTIAVVSKYPLQSAYLNDDLQMEGLYIPNIDETKNITTEKGGVFTIPSYLSKGLEFDAVILNGVSEKYYDSNSKSDMKLLYVASTRALHEMDVVYDNEISEPLKSFVENTKVMNNNIKIRTR